MKKCSCSAINNPKSRYCYKCGRPISIDVAIQDEETLRLEINNTTNF